MEWLHNFDTDTLCTRLQFLSSAQQRHPSIKIKKKERRNGTHEEWCEAVMAAQPGAFPSHRALTAPGCNQGAAAMSPAVLFEGPLLLHAQRALIGLLH